MASKSQALAKLKGSPFFEEVCSIAFQIDYHCIKRAAETDYQKHTLYDEIVNKNISRWGVAKSALLFITSKTYAYTRTDEYFGIVNEADENDWLYQSRR